MATRAGQTEAGTPDGTLVERARRGDLDAFSELVRRHQRPLMAKALGSTRSVADADDAVQETFMRAWRGLARFRDSARFGGWLHRILGNLLADRGRRAAREIHLGETGVPEIADPASRPDERLLADELRRALDRAIDALPDGRQREVFRMRYVDGLTIPEIAARLGVHAGTIKVHLFRTSQRLRSLLGSLEVVR